MQTVEQIPAGGGAYGVRRCLCSRKLGEGRAQGVEPVVGVAWNAESLVNQGQDTVAQCPGHHILGDQRAGRAGRFAKPFAHAFAKALAAHQPGEQRHHGGPVTDPAVCRVGVHR